VTCSRRGPGEGQNTLPWPRGRHQRTGYLSTASTCRPTGLRAGRCPRHVHRRRRLPVASACTTTSTGVSATGPAPARPPRPATESFRPETRASRRIVANADSALPDRQPSSASNGDVVGIRGKAPTTPSGPTPLPGRWREDLRYYSMCVNLDEQPFPLVVNPLPSGRWTTDAVMTSRPDSTPGYYHLRGRHRIPAAAVQALPA